MIDRVAPSLQDMLPSGDQLAPFHRSLGESFFHAFADPDVAFILLVHVPSIPDAKPEPTFWINLETP